ncbi:family 16 glycosylhydrolase [Flammeovirga pacifica]|uniref:GH16 domain-containing protein n=1 Tax=Flammeovirga pacifica TaxID=915059 RepID=A0A1S1YSL8_FLAPC|nr:family 16 glycosylhydrolase [Flammeovirga pacifica]OHX63863.1 hypothetical protein NH26_19825 [Flammeovirga pacifica]
MNRFFKFLLVGCSALAINTYGQTPYTDPNNQEGWVLNPEVSDEFKSGSLDKDKWIVQGENDHFENKFKGRAPSQFAPHAVSVENNELVITTRWEPGYEFMKGKHQGHKFENITTGAIISKKKFKHGYMEIRCKAADGPLSSAFWFTGKGGELDIFEIFGKYPKDKHHEKVYHTSFHDWSKNPKDPLFGKTSWDNKVQLPFRLAEDYHVYGCEWNEDFMKIFIDGHLVRQITREELGDKWVMNNEQKVWVDNEVFPWKVNPKKEDIPAEGLKFHIDYVRVWQKDSGMASSSQLIEQNNLLANGSFEDGLEGWETTGKVKLMTKKGSFDGSNHIKLAAGSEATATLHMKLKPNTTYVLSAYARLPNSDEKTIYDNGWLGVKNYGAGQQPIIKYFKNDWYRQSILFTTGKNANDTMIYFTNKWKKNEVRVDHFELVESPSFQETHIKTK